MTPAPAVLLDSTLRDGEQAAGVALTAAEKHEYVRLAEAAGVRYVEIGFPQNELDFAACKAAAQAASSARLVAMALTTPDSIDCVRRIGAHEVLFVVPCSRSHLETTYGGGFDELRAQLAASIDAARAGGLEVNIGLEDASRHDPEVLARLFDELALHSGAIGCITAADTRGLLIPSETVALLAPLRERATALGARLAFHAHNDLGLATANSLAALTMDAPVDCVHVTCCGFGERAGNASLEQLAVLLEIKLGRRSGIALERLIGLADFVSEIFMTPLSMHAPLVGDKVFLHGSGLHQRAQLQDGSAYQFLDPARFGAHSELILGKHSGKRLRRLLAERAGVGEAEVWALQRELAERDKTATKREVLERREDIWMRSFLGLSSDEAIERLKKG